MKIISALAAAAVLGLSAAPALAQSAFDGGYVGIQGGYATGAFELETGIGTTTAGGHGAEGELFAGYGTSFDGIYVGIEGFGGYSDVAHTTESSVDTSIEKDETFGIAARVGITPTIDSLLYASAGLARTVYTFNAGTTEETREGVSYRLAGGVQKVVSENVFARLEVGFDFPKDPITDGAGGEFRPMTQTARIGLGFSF